MRCLLACVLLSPLAAGAMGFAEPGGWSKGVYTVSCAIGGQPVAVERSSVE
jgi:hypothetical protein